MATDSAYEQQIAALNARQANQQLGIDEKTQQTEAAYGFDPKYASDPYTKANLLARASATRFTRSTNSYASRYGGLYSGALSRQRAGDEFTSGLEQDTAKKEYAAALGNLRDQGLANQSDYALGSANAYGDLQSRLNATPVAPVEPPGGAGGGGGPGPGQTSAGGGANQTQIAKAQDILKNPRASHAAKVWAHNILGK